MHPNHSNRIAPLAGGNLQIHPPEENVIRSAVLLPLCGGAHQLWVTVEKQTWFVAIRNKKNKPSLVPKESGTIEVVRLASGKKPVKEQDFVVLEAPLEIRVRGRSVAVTMRTPGHDRELAAGFLLSEKIIHDRSQLVDIAPSYSSLEPENTLSVFLRPGVEVDFERLTRHVFATSSCGLCGKASIDAVKQNFPPVKTSVTVPAKTIFQLSDRMKRAQKTFASTGGLHAAAVFDSRGKLLVLREDVGRHNAVDKVIGWGLLENKLPFDSHVLLVSGRASFEIMQKALAARLPIVCAVSAPSSLAVDFARASGQTLVGFLREKSMNVYCGAGIE